MRVAVTADLHLTDRESHPERYEVLGTIFDELNRLNIDRLFIAGDLFDQHSRNYTDFDQICQSPKAKKIKIVIIPGNHDPELKTTAITADNVTVFHNPELFQSNVFSMPILFLPYKAKTTMGETAMPLVSGLEANRWILIGHGDWIAGLREVNPHEPGVYMPLGRADVERLKPARVIMGHIHKKLDFDPVFYPGSPCPLDINETGPRRILILDTETASVESVTVESGPLYFQETVLILPVEDETNFIKEQIESKIKSWNLKTGDQKRARIRIKVKGYSANKRKLAEILQTGFKDWHFYKETTPDLSEVYDAGESDNTEIARRLKSAIASLPYQPGPDDPDPESVLLHALHTIYGEA